MKAIVYLSSPFDTRPRPFVVEVPAGSTPGNCWQHEDRHYYASRSFSFAVNPQASIHTRINQRADYLHRIGASGRRVTPPGYHFPDYVCTVHRIQKAVRRHLRRHTPLAIPSPALAA